MYAGATVGDGSPEDSHDRTRKPIATQKRDSRSLRLTGLASKRHGVCLISSGVRTSLEGPSVSLLVAGLGPAGRIGVICAVGVAQGSSDPPVLLVVSFL